jgi:hypothetical protein
MNKAAKNRIEGKKVTASNAMVISKKQKLPRPIRAKGMYQRRIFISRDSMFSPYYQHFLTIAILSVNFCIE